MLREEEDTSGGEQEEEQEQELEEQEEEEVEPDMSVTSGDFYMAMPVVINTAGEEEEEEEEKRVKHRANVPVLFLGHHVGESSTDKDHAKIPTSDPDRSPNGSPDTIHSGDGAPAPGSVADREHRKWEEEAVTLQHNPYSRSGNRHMLHPATLRLHPAFTRP